MIRTLLFVSCVCLLGCSSDKAPATPPDKGGQKADGTGAAPSKPADSAAPAGQPETAKPDPVTELPAITAKITRDEFDQIQLGMSDAAVKKIMGEPSTDTTADGETILMYPTPDFTKSIIVKLRGGKVVQRLGTRLSAELPVTLTKENVTAVEKGQAVADVVKRMGPANSENDPDPVTGEGAMTWGTNEKGLNITFKDGRVTDAVHFGFDE